MCDEDATESTFEPYGEYFGHGTLHYVSISIDVGTMYKSFSTNHTPILFQLTLAASLSNWEEKEKSVLC